MIVILLGILDLIVAISLFGLQFGWFSVLAIPSIIYLLVKGIVFIKDPFSIIDIIIAVYIILLLIGIKTFITYIFILYLLYKFFFAFVG